MFMKFPNLNSNDYSISPFEGTAHNFTNQKELVYNDGSSEIVYFGAKTPQVEIKIVMLSFAEFTALKTYFLTYATSVKVVQSSLFGEEFSNVKEWICTASNLSFEGQEQFSKSGLDYSITILFTLKSYIKNDLSQVNVNSVNSDFKVKIYPNAVICDIFKDHLVVGTYNNMGDSVVIGDYDLPASLVPEATFDGDRVFVKSHWLTQEGNPSNILKKKYSLLYVKSGSSLILVNHLKYTDVTFTTNESSDVAKHNDTALFSASMTRAFHTFNANTGLWVATKIPSINQFAHVILSSSHPSIERGTDFLNINYFQNHYLVGLDLPSKSISIEEGASVEHPNSFSVAFNNADRLHWKSLNSGFYGAVAEVYYLESSIEHLICKGVCTQIDENLGAFNLNFEPFSFNLYEKIINPNSNRKTFGSWGYCDLVNESEATFEIVAIAEYDTTSGSQDIVYSALYSENSNFSLSDVKKYFIQLDSGDYWGITNGTSSVINVHEEFLRNITTKHGKCTFFKFSNNHLIDDRIVFNGQNDIQIKTISIQDNGFLAYSFSGQLSFINDTGKIIYENNSGAYIKATEKGVITSKDISQYKILFQDNDLVNPYRFDLPSMPHPYSGTLTNLGYGFYCNNSYAPDRVDLFHGAYINYGSSPSPSATGKIQLNKDFTTIYEIASTYNELRFLMMYEFDLGDSIESGEMIYFDKIEPYVNLKYIPKSGVAPKELYYADIYFLQKELFNPSTGVTNPSAFVLAQADVLIKNETDYIYNIKIDSANGFALGKWNVSHVAIMLKLKPSTLIVGDISTPISFIEFTYKYEYFNSTSSPIFYLDSKKDNIITLDNPLYIKDFKGRLDSYQGAYCENYNTIYNEMTRTANIPIQIANFPTQVYSDKLRMRVDSEISLDTFLGDISLHSFCGLRLGIDGNYEPFLLEINQNNAPIDSSDSRFFDDSKIIEGSFNSVQYRDSKDIANGIEVLYHYSAIDEKLTKKLRAYVSGNQIKIDGLDSIDLDKYEVGASAEFKNTLKANLNTLKDSMDISRTFYGVASQSNKSFELPWFYDLSTFDDGIKNSDKQPITSVVDWIARCAQWFLFNAWTFSFDVKINLVLGSDPLKIGDIVTTSTYFHSENTAVFGVVKGINYNIDESTASIEIYCPIPPEVSNMWYDNIWDGGIITTNYVASNRVHKQLIQKYPLKINPEGNFSDGGIIDGSYDATQLQFIDDTFADAMEEKGELPT